MAQKPKRVVIKIGTRVLIEKSGELNVARMNAIVADVAKLIESGIEVAIVSSGAVGLGMGRLSLASKPKKLSAKQKCAAVGQGILIQKWEESFAQYNLPVAQLLLTREDVDNHHRHCALKEVIDEILSDKIVPVINENDPISASELNVKFGDNDILSALIASLVKADVLLILSTAGGLIDMRGTNEIVKEVDKVDDKVKAMANTSTSVGGTGGMVTKLRAAEIATKSACKAYIASGDIKNVVSRTILDGENLGTYFKPCKGSPVSKKRWFAHFGKSMGRLFVDEGAANALKNRGASLLAAGVVDVAGNFKAGDLVDIVLNGTSALVARGLASYDAKEIMKSKSTSTSEVAVHRDNLALL